MVVHTSLAQSCSSFYWQFFVFLTFSIGQRIKWELLFIVWPIFLCCAIRHSHSVRYVVICVIMILIIADFFHKVAQRELPWNILRNILTIDRSPSMKNQNIDLRTWRSSIFIQNNKLWLWNIRMCNYLTFISIHAHNSPLSEWYPYCVFDGYTCECVSVPTCVDLTSAKMAVLCAEHRLWQQ